VRHPTDDLSALVDGALPPRRAEEVRHHLSGCESCRALHARITGAVAALSGLPPPPEPSPWFAVRLEARLASEASRRRGPLARLAALAVRWRIAAPVGALAVAAAVTVVVVRTRAANERELASQLDLLADYEVVANLDALSSPGDAEIATHLDALEAEGSPR